MSGKSIVILGGGTGGLVAANRLRRLLGREHRITLVDRSEHHLFAPSYLWLMLGQRKLPQIRRPLARLAPKGIEVRQAEVEQIDVAASTVRTSSGDLGYDYLVVALGAQTAIEAVPGLAEAAYNLYDPQGAQRLAQAVAEFAGGKVAVLISKMPFKCPAAPYEAALLLEDHFAGKGLRPKVELAVYTPETLPMPTAGPAMGHSLAAMLAGRGVDFRPQHVVRSVNPAARLIEFESGATAAYDLLLTVPPHTSPQVVRESALAAESGWIPVDPHTLQTRHANVFALGDNAAIQIGSGMMLPKAGVFAHEQAEVVAQNIADTIKGLSPTRRFAGRGYCFVELGSGKAAFATGDFYADPKPALQLRTPGRRWHWGKVAFEKWWLWHWF